MSRESVLKRTIKPLRDIKDEIKLSQMETLITTVKCHIRLLKIKGAVSKQNEIAPNYFKRKRVPKGPFIVRIIV